MSWSVLSRSSLSRFGGPPGAWNMEPCGKPVFLHIIAGEPVPVHYGYSLWLCVVFDVAREVRKHSRRKEEMRIKKNCRKHSRTKFHWVARCRHHRLPPPHKSTSLLVTFECVPFAGGCCEGESDYTNLAAVSHSIAYLARGARVLFVLQLHADQSIALCRLTFKRAIGMGGAGRTWWLGAVFVQFPTVVWCMWDVFSYMCVSKMVLIILLCCLLLNVMFEVISFLYL